jgi:SAM-dependent methyltransferase
MDFRGFNLTENQISTALELSCLGTLLYQPFVFSDDFATGAGYEFFDGGENGGLVYCPDAEILRPGCPHRNRMIYDPAKRDRFFNANDRLNRLYRKFNDLITARLDISNSRIADIGCCSGYFPVSLSALGARDVTGFDLVDYSDTFALLNGILNTDAKFVNSGYDYGTRGIAEFEHYDLIICSALLVHLSEPLGLLALMGQRASKAIFIWTNVGAEPDMSVHYISANRYYENARFPHCFDMTIVSRELLLQSLRLMGFDEFHFISNEDGLVSEEFHDTHCGVLALRSA